jgi:hypothetical protein
MRLLAMDIPDDPAELPGWLERHLVGLDLAALVAELEAVHGLPTGPVPTVRDVLGDRLDTVLAGGLERLPHEVLGRLLRQPRLLLELQEQVLVAGGDYWDRVDRPSADLDAGIGRDREWLDAFLRSPDGIKPATDVLPRFAPGAWYRRPWFVGLATAASVLVLVGAYELQRPTPDKQLVIAESGWGWNRPGAVRQDLPAPAYLGRLADSATEWYQKRPDDPVALARRISDLRQGCSVLILAEHKPLPAEDRKWLAEKCRTWAAKLDSHLAAVEAGEDPLKVRAGVDETVRNLVEALRQRAQSQA